MKSLLYYSPGACSLAPHILLEEKGFDYELVEVNVQLGKTQEQTFLTVNPKGRVPVLVISGQVLTEVPAICWYIGSARTGPCTLAPDTILDQARALEWFNWLSGTLHSVAFGGKWRPQRFATNPALHGEIKAQAETNLREGFAYIEERLSSKEWALGNGYGIVDPYLFVFYLWACAIGIDTSTDYPNWHAHAARMYARPAVRRALQQEGLSFSPLINVSGKN